MNLVVDGVVYARQHVVGINTFHGAVLPRLATRHDVTVYLLVPRQCIGVPPGPPVDLANATSLQFFDLVNVSLATLFAPSITGNETLSFVGGLFNAGEQVGRVRITSGNSALGPNESLPATDLVVMDDFVYAEPRAISAVPEPASLGLFPLGVLLIWGFRRSTAQHVSFRRAVRPRQ